MAIPLIAEAAPKPLALSDGVQMLIVELSEGDPELVAWVREAEDSEVEGGTVVAGRGRKGKRDEYRCAACGYGIVVHGQPPRCPMCREARWEHVEWRPFSQLLDLPLPVGTRSQRRRLDAPASPTAEEPISHLRPGQAGASPENGSSGIPVGGATGTCRRRGGSLASSNSSRRRRRFHGEEAVPDGDI